MVYKYDEILSILRKSITDLKELKKQRKKYITENDASTAHPEPSTSEDGNQHNPWSD